MPLVSQSDPGTENFGLANGHTLLRHLQDPDLEGTLQHRWMREKKNVMPEIGWSQLHHRFTPGFEDILDVGVNNGWYDPNELVEAYVISFQPHIMFTYTQFISLVFRCSVAATSDLATSSRLRQGDLSRVKSSSLMTLLRLPSQ